MARTVEVIETPGERAPSAMALREDGREIQHQWAHSEEQAVTSR